MPFYDRLSGRAPGRFSRGWGRAIKWVAIVAVAAIVLVFLAPPLLAALGVMFAGGAAAYAAPRSRAKGQGLMGRVKAALSTGRAGTEASSKAATAPPADGAQANGQIDEKRLEGPANLWPAQGEVRRRARDRTPQLRNTSHLLLLGGAIALASALPSTALAAAPALILPVAAFPLLMVALVVLGATVAVVAVARAATAKARTDRAVSDDRRDVAIARERTERRENRRGLFGLIFGRRRERA